jgi:hypothetical protein
LAKASAEVSAQKFERVEIDLLRMPGSGTPLGPVGSWWDVFFQLLLEGEELPDSHNHQID